MSSFKYNNKNIRNKKAMPMYFTTHPSYRNQVSRNLNVEQIVNENIWNSLVKPTIETMVDFATTACNRPDILEKTYSTLANKMKGINMRECRLILNVDPMPNNENMERNLEVANKYFKEVVINYTEKGSFPRAFRWCVSQVERPYCFYVQDDWGFVQDFNIKTLIQLVRKSNQIASVNLYKTDGGSSNSYRIYLSPSLFKTHHLKKIDKMLLPDYSPEKQLRPMHPTKNPYPYGGRILKALRYHGICYRKNMYPMVIDLGRPWMQTKGFRKSSGIYGNFQSWETKNGTPISVNTNIEESQTVDDNTE